jgi:histidinol-phosphate/aromatic aminotransferase/cobyric acid decarboxylase-like protein
MSQDRKTFEALVRGVARGTVSERRLANFILCLEGDGERRAKYRRALDKSALMARTPGQQQRLLRACSLSVVPVERVELDQTFRIEV